LNRRGKEAVIYRKINQGRNRLLTVDFGLWILGMITLATFNFDKLEKSLFRAILATFGK